jgi:hypothetical protein
LVLFVRNGTFQWVVAIPNRISLPALSLVAKRLASDFYSDDQAKVTQLPIFIKQWNRKARQRTREAARVAKGEKGTVAAGQ